MRAFLVRLLLAALARSCSSTTSNAFLHGVTVSRAMVMTSPSLEEFSASFSHILRCSVLCRWRPWCGLWCWDASVGVCFFSNIIVMPGYSGHVAEEDALQCYTLKPKDFATGADIDGSQHYIGRNRPPINLVDGIYDLQTVDMCYMSLTNYDYPWLLLDFGKPKSVRLVRMMTQATGLLAWVQSVANLEVRVGLQAPTTPGDFSSFDVLGSYPGPASSYNQEVVIEAAAPVTTRFLSIQKMESMTKLQVCHLEVY